MKLSGNLSMNNINSDIYYKKHGKVKN
jgi:hypothetical protein